MRHPNETRAYLLPRNFYDDVPDVTLDPSFSHHFVSDVGAFPAITHVSCLTGHDAAEAMLQNRSLRSRPEEADMARRWSDLSARSRRLIIAVAVVEAGLKAAVLVDLKRRPASKVRGSKRMWAAAMLLNSAGLTPLSYFAFGRQDTAA